jgi:hypothetical protein
MIVIALRGWAAVRVLPDPGHPPMALENDSELFASDFMDTAL